MPGPVPMTSCVSALCYLPVLCSEFCMFTLHEKVIYILFFMDQLKLKLQDAYAKFNSFCNKTYRN